MATFRDCDTACVVWCPWHFTMSRYLYGNSELPDPLKLPKEPRLWSENSVRTAGFTVQLPAQYFLNSVAELQTQHSTLDNGDLVVSVDWRGDAGYDAFIGSVMYALRTQCTAFTGIKQSKTPRTTKGRLPRPPFRFSSTELQQGPGGVASRPHCIRAAPSPPPPPLNPHPLIHMQMWTLRSWAATW